MQYIDAMIGIPGLDDRPPDFARHSTYTPPPRLDNSLSAFHSDISYTFLVYLSFIFPTHCVCIRHTLCMYSLAIHILRHTHSKTVFGLLPRNSLSTLNDLLHVLQN